MSTPEFRNKLRKTYRTGYIDYGEKIIINGKTFFICMGKVFLSFSYVGSMFGQVSCEYLSRDTFARTVLRNPNYDYHKLIGYRRVTDIEKLFIIKNIDVIKTDINTTSVMASKYDDKSIDTISLYIDFDDFFLLKL